MQGFCLFKETVMSWLWGHSEQQFLNNWNRLYVAQVPEDFLHIFCGLSLHQLLPPVSKYCNCQNGQNLQVVKPQNSVPDQQSLSMKWLEQQHAKNLPGQHPDIQQNQTSATGRQWWADGHWAQQPSDELFEDCDTEVTLQTACWDQEFLVDSCSSCAANRNIYANSAQSVSARSTLCTSVWTQSRRSRYLRRDSKSDQRRNPVLWKAELHWMETLRVCFHLQFEI